MDDAALLEMLEAQMKEAAAALDFEQAANLRDQVFELKARMSGGGAKKGAGLGRLPSARARDGSVPAALTRAELTAWGERFGRTAAAPLVVTIRGELGAGKTTLVQAICRGCRRDAGGHQPDLRARASSTRRPSRRCIISISTASTVPRN